MKGNSENKKRLVNPKGYTKDIMNAVLDCYDKNRQTVPSKLIYLCSEFDDDKEMCDFIFHWVDENIEYKADPEGEQWIKTPARLIDDGVGDCKSFTILLCSILSAFGIQNMFRFVAYKGRDYTHVYPVAIIDGQEFPIDVVAYKQKGIQIGQELTYKKKYDRMNSTRISQLSGVDGVDGMSCKVDDSMSVAELVSSSMCLVAMSQLRTDDYWAYTMLTELIRLYQKNLDNLKTACYHWLASNFSYRTFKYFPQKGTPSWDARLRTIESAIARPSDYSIDPSITDNKDFKERWNWLEKEIFPYVNKYAEDSDNIQASKDLLNVGMNGLYLFIGNSYLTLAQKEKKANQNIFLEMLVQGTAFTELSAKNFVYAGFLSMYKVTPQECFNVMFGKSIPSSYRAYMAGEDDDFCGQIEFNPNSGAYEVVQKAEVVSDKETVSSQIGSWLDKATGWFTSIWNAVTGGSSNDTYRKVTPNYSDSEGSMFGWVMLFGAVALGFLVLKKKRR